MRMFSRLIAASLLIGSATVYSRDDGPAVGRVVTSQSLTNGRRLVVRETEEPGDTAKQRVLSYSFDLEIPDAPPQHLGSTSLDDDHPVGSKEAARSRLAGLGMSDDGTLVVVENEADLYYTANIFPAKLAHGDPNQGLAEQIEHGRRYLHIIVPGEAERTAKISGKVSDHSLRIILTDSRSGAEEQWKPGMIENGTHFGWMPVPAATTRPTTVPTSTATRP
jgi:hypothetical protein